MFDQDHAIRLLATGASLRQAGKQLRCSASHICETAAADPHFGERYARAMAIRAEHDVDELREIKRKVATGELTPDQARVMADLIKWPASKRMPKVFGDKLQVDQDVRLQVELVDATAQPAQAQITAQVSLPVQTALAHKAQEDPL